MAAFASGSLRLFAEVDQVALLEGGVTGAERLEFVIRIARVRNIRVAEVFDLGQRCAGVDPGHLLLGNLGAGGVREQATQPARRLAKFSQNLPNRIRHADRHAAARAARQRGHDEHAGNRVADLGAGGVDGVRHRLGAGDLGKNLAQLGEDRGGVFHEGQPSERPQPLGEQRARDAIKPAAIQPAQQFLRVGSVMLGVMQWGQERFGDVQGFAGIDPPYPPQTLAVGVHEKKAEDRYVGVSVVLVMQAFLQTPQGGPGQAADAQEQGGAQARLSRWHARFRRALHGVRLTVHLAVREDRHRLGEVPLFQLGRRTANIRRQNSRFRRSGRRFRLLADRRRRDRVDVGGVAAGVQGFDHLQAGAETLFGHLRERPGDDAAINAGQGTEQRLTIDVLVGQLHHGRAGERPNAREHFLVHDGEAVLIAVAADRPSNASGVA